jgi:D-alanyl-D-alanine carboxypeptidase
VLALTATSCSASAPQVPSAQLTPASVTRQSNRGETSASPDDTSPDTPARLFDSRRHSLSDPDSVWVVVNKATPIRPLRHRPELDIVHGYQVHPRAAPALTALLRAARRAGLRLRIMSAFRSYEYQHALHQRAVSSMGPATAERVSARPGHSEHQTGLAVDFGSEVAGDCNVKPCFAETPEGRWLASNAQRFGFIIRYPRGAEAVTGYAAETWHYRFVGRPLADEMARQGIRTLEEFFGVPGGGYR